MGYTTKKEALAIREREIKEVLEKGHEHKRAMEDRLGRIIDDMEHEWEAEGWDVEECARGFLFDNYPEFIGAYAYYIEGDIRVEYGNVGKTVGSEHAGY